MTDAATNLEQRLPRVTSIMLGAGATSAIAGWRLTTDGFGVVPFLPLLLGIACAVISVRHSLTIRTWYDRREKEALRPVLLVGAVAAATGIVGALSNRVSMEDKVTGAFLLVVSVAFLWRATVFLVRLRRRVTAG